MPYSLSSDAPPTLRSTHITSMCRFASASLLIRPDEAMSAAVGRSRLPSDARRRGDERGIVEQHFELAHVSAPPGGFNIVRGTRRRDCFNALSCSSRPSSSYAARLSMSCAKPSACSTLITVARLVLGSPTSSFRSVGRVTPTRKANLFTNFLSTPPSSAVWHCIPDHARSDHSQMPESRRAVWIRCWR